MNCFECGELAADDPSVPCGGFGHEGTADAGSWYCGVCWGKWLDDEAEKLASTTASTDHMVTQMYLAELPPALPPFVVLARDRLVFVSLGSWCGVKMAMRAIGLEPGASLPFDWVRVSLAGVASAIDRAFAGFLDCMEVSEVSQGPGAGMRYVVPGLHAFHHDDSRLGAHRAKYARRFDRFGKLASAAVAATPLSTETVSAVMSASASSSASLPLVFVRSLASTFELDELQGLLTFLTQRFSSRGSEIFLVGILDAQHQDTLLLFEDEPRLLLRLVASHHHRQGEGFSSRAYHLPLAAVAARLLSRNRNPRDVFDTDFADVVFLPSISVLIAPLAIRGCDARGCIAGIQHASLGEDLKQVMNCVPEMPPASLMRQTCVAAPPSTTTGIVEACTKAHLNALRATGHADSGIPQDVRWRSLGGLNVMVQMAARELRRSVSSATRFVAID